MPLIQLRDYQASAVNDVRAAFRRKQSPVLFVLPTGGGKCLGSGTPILMFDGSIKPVDDVVVGDELMGPDSLPRKVLSLARGREMLYRVTPTKGDAYVVNESHILSLKKTATHRDPKYPCQDRAGEVVNVSVLDYFKTSATFKHTHKGWRAAVDFPCGVTPDDVIEPYFLGAWLGDGHSHIAHITTGDEEVVQYMIDYAARVGMKLAWRDNSDLSIVVMLQGESLTGRGGTPVMNALRALGVIRNKHIPMPFKTASRQHRLELLAGIIDTDGHYTGKGYDITLSSERLLDDVVFVARSLGLSAYKSPSRKTCHNNGVSGDYWRCTISGDVDRIPCKIERKKAAPRAQKKSVLVTGISVCPIGVGDYFGFEIDGDHLFMLGDFTVTHNTYTFTYIVSEAQKKAPAGEYIFIIVHRKELLLQASKSLSSLGVEHGLISPDFTPCPHHTIQVASVDTLAIRLKKKAMKAYLVVFDEAHHVVDGNKWGRVYDLLKRPPMLGVTATPCRTDGKGLGLHAGGLFQSMVIGPNVRDLIDRGCLINPTLYAALVIPDMEGVKKTRDGEYDRNQAAERVDKPKITGDTVDQYSRICPGERAIVFCASIEHAKHVRDAFNARGFRFALLVGEPEMSGDERTRVNNALRSGELHGACTVDLVSEGYDLPDLAVCIMLRPTASEGLFLQQVGRVMRPSDGKTECWLIDQVGNSVCIVGGALKRKHGLPDEVREWTLDGRKKKPKKKDDDDEPPIDLKQCPKCFVVHEPAPVCPKCGFVYPAAPGRQIEQVDGELFKITTEMAEQAKKARLEEVRKAKSLDDLERIGRERGYSPGWAKHTHEAKQRIRAKYARPEPPIDAYMDDR